MRIVSPLRLVGAKFMVFSDDVTLASGAYVAALTDLVLQPRLEIGRGTKIGDHSHIICAHSVTFGERVLAANRVFVTDNGHRYADVDVAIMDQRLEALAAVHIGDHSWIGENVCILGASIGRHCVIASNSVVNRDVPDYCVAAGAPAKIVRRYSPEHGQWLPTDGQGKFASDADV